ncbi:kelch repeat domain [Anaeramoeba flamelloides]|uniref:Kelch repeat domain n=1 Tax=Anaeramoeba flamelloides TaxID=1746091 RepID=A0ABQ8Y2P9_9EUKA|nr:kelch repeat domain [Anaeramoeba flamelloides]
METKTNGQECTPRYKHAIVEVSDNTHYLFGGRCQGWLCFLNDTYKLEFHDDVAEFTEITVNGQTPSSRFGSCDQFYDDKMYVIGGASYQDDDTLILFDDVWELDISTHTWTQIETTGDAPTARYGHSCVVEGDSIYFFGGATGKKAFSNETWRISLSDHTWEKLSPEIAPPPRYGHSSHVFNKEYTDDQNKLNVWGGRIKANGDAVYLNDMWEYCFQTNTWEQIIPTDYNNIPTGRFEFAYNGGEGGKILNIMGGMHFTVAEKEAYNDFWSFDRETLNWEELDQGDNPPSTMYGHSGHSNFHIFGGKNGHYEDEEEIYNDIWVYNYLQNEDENVISSGAFTQISNMLAIGTLLLIFIFFFH